MNDTLTETKSMEDQVRDVMAVCAEDIKRRLQEQVKEQVIESLTYSLRNDISERVSKFIQEEMASDISGILLESRESILTEIRAAMVKIVATAGEAMVEKATKNLEQSWNVGKVVDGLFK